MLRLPLTLILGAVLALPAWAGRPLASDDAGTTPAGECQLEAWAEHSADEDALVLAPACGLTDGLELGADTARLHPDDTVRQAAGLALKWVPPAAAWATPLGELALGLKLGLAAEDDVDAGWRHTGTVVLGLASLQLNADAALHLNLGPVRDRVGGVTGTALNLAATWTPSAAWLLAAEWQGNDRWAHFGSPVRSAGLRWWLQADTLGLDLTASREAGGGPTRWLLGFGWYGLTL